MTPHFIRNISISQVRINKNRRFLLIKRHGLDNLIDDHRLGDLMSKSLLADQAIQLIRA